MRYPPPKAVIPIGEHDVFTRPLVDGTLDTDRAFRTALDTLVAARASDPETTSKLAVPTHLPVTVGM